MPIILERLVSLLGVDRIFDYVWHYTYMVVKPPIMFKSLELCCYPPSCRRWQSSMPGCLPVYLVSDPSSLLEGGGSKSLHTHLPIAKT